MKLELRNLLLDEYLENELAYKAQLENDQNRLSIPLLNYVPSHALLDNSLVRFRGMIQDMMDPEMYLEKYEMQSETGSRIQNGRFRDIFVCQVIRIWFEFL